MVAISLRVLYVSLYFFSNKAVDKKSSLSPPQGVSLKGRHVETQKGKNAKSALIEVQFPDAKI